MDEFPLIFFSLFVFNKTLLLTNIWVFLATPVCPSSALGSQDGYFQVPCAPGAQHDHCPTVAKVVRGWCPAGGMGWFGTSLLSPVPAAGGSQVPAGVSLGRSQRGVCCVLDL